MTQPIHPSEIPLTGDYKECLDETELHQHADSSFFPDGIRGG
jgi:hypothetical protein